MHISFRRRGSVLVSALAVVLILALAARGQEAGRYFTALPDLPIMPALREVPEAGVSFDKPEGRIVEVYAEGLAGPDEVLRFYHQTLPQLGWQASGPKSFRREGEVLALDLESDGDRLTLRCSLRPE